MDVIYTGLHNSPEDVVAAAVQEDVDVLGVSLLSGAHMTILPRMIELLKESDADDIILVAGGVMPDGDAAELRKLGVDELILQDSSPDDIVGAITRLVEARGPR